MKYHSNYVNLIFAVGIRGESERGKSSIIENLLTAHVEKVFGFVACHVTKQFVNSILYLFH